SEVRQVSPKAGSMTRGRRAVARCGPGLVEAVTPPPGPPWSVLHSRPAGASCRVGGGGALSPYLRPLTQTAPTTFPQTPFLNGSLRESSLPQTRHEMSQAHQTKLPNQPCSGIPAPHRVPPSLGTKRVEPVLDPPVKLMKEAAHMRFAVIGAPAANHWIHLL